MVSNANTAPPPGDLAIAWYPVGTGVTCLTAAEMPNGNVFVLWMQGGWYSALRGAVVDSHRALLANDAVPEGDKWTLDASGTVSASAFSHGGNLYYSQQHISGYPGTATHRIWKADDPNNPAGGFSLHGTVQSFSAPGQSIFDQQGMAQAGHPWIEGSRWVYPGGSFVNIFGFLSAYVGLWASEDGGVNWTRPVHQGIGALGADTQFIAGAIAEQANGNLYFTAHGASNQVLRWESTNRGASWTLLWNSTAASIDTACTTYDGITYTLGIQNINTDPDLSTVEGSSIVSTHPLGLKRNMLRAVQFENSIFLFGGEDVQQTLGGWTVGYIGIG